MISIEIAEDYQVLVDAETLTLAAQTVLHQEELQEEQDLTIAVEGDDRLHELNRDYLGIDAPTDVLSFPSGEEIDPETERVYLGDIILSYPRALQQATSAGHEVMSEIQLLVIHGVLHLLGYDHATPEEKTAMWAAQAEAIQTLGIHLNRLPEEPYD